MMNFPIFEVPMIEIPIKKGIHLFLKREDLVDEEISGNKYWKLFYNIKTKFHEFSLLTFLNRYHSSRRSFIKIKEHYACYIHPCLNQYKLLFVFYKVTKPFLVPLFIIFCFITSAAAKIKSHYILWFFKKFFNLTHYIDLVLYLCYNGLKKHSILFTTEEFNK